MQDLPSNCSSKYYYSRMLQVSSLKILLNLLTLLFWETVLWADQPILHSGSLRGILTAKGDAWVDVKNDQGYTHRYLAKWRGASPSSGGGFDPKDIKLIAELVVGNRVKLDWFWENHLRIGNLELLRPLQNNGVFKGYVLQTSDRWIDVQNPQEGVPWRFYLPWVGGYPQNGGGYDQGIIEEINERPANDPIRFSWIYDRRSRMVQLYGVEDYEFVPFYVGKVDTYTPLRKKLLEKKSQEAEKGTSPFEQAAPAGNPFEQAAPQGNPFEK